MNDATLTPYESPATFVASLGTFWAGFYNALRRTELNGIAAGAVTLLGDIADTVKYTTDSLYRDTAPPFMTRRLIRIAIDLSTRELIPIAYGSGAVYGDGTLYGQGALGVSYAAPQDLVFVSYIGDRITSPSVALTYGQDFEIKAGRMLFFEDPASDDRWKTIKDADGNTLLIAWGWAAKYEKQFGYRYSGYTVGVHDQDSRRTLSLAAAIGERLASGATVGQFLKTLGAVVESPVAEEKETVTNVGQDAAGGWISTDTRVYRMPSGAAATVSPGQIVNFGQSLCDGVLYAELNRGTLPSWVEILAITPELMSNQVSGTIGFLNQAQPLTRLTISGVQRFRFPVCATKETAAQFWAQIDRAEDATNDAWARAIQGSGGVFPTTINPAVAIASTALRRGTAIVSLGVTGLAPTWGIIADAINPHSRVVWTGRLPDIVDKADTVVSDMIDPPTGGVTMSDLASAPVDYLLTPYPGENSC